MLLSEKIPSLLVLQDLWLFQTTISRSLLLFSPRQPEEEDNWCCDDAEGEDDTEGSGGKKRNRKNDVSEPSSPLSWHNVDQSDGGKRNPLCDNIHLLWYFVDIRLLDSNIFWELISEMEL